MVYRIHFGAPQLRRSTDGLEIGIVFGMCNSIWKMLRRLENPSHVAAVFDTGKPTFRHGFYPQYKANRPPRPDAIVAQMPLVREAFRMFGIAVIDAVGYEADDVIATYAKQASALQSLVTIATTDKDAAQLVDQYISIWGPKGVIIGPATVERQWGVPPSLIVDLQALAGDQVDNVPGVTGIGPKKAMSLVRQFGDIEEVFARGPGTIKGKLGEILADPANLELARLSKRLVTLETNVPGIPPVEWLRRGDVNWRDLIGFLHRYEMLTLASEVSEFCGLSMLSPA